MREVRLSRTSDFADAAGDRIVLVDTNAEARDVLARRLRAQGYSVETAPDAATGADIALSAPPSALVADLWMPCISGIQLCRLLRAEAATADVPIILRGETDDPRSRFWAERAGALAYVPRGRMGELVRALSRAVASAQKGPQFFMQCSEGVDVRERIARHLDVALFESVIAAEVRALATAGSFERLFDLFSQFVSQLIAYRWLAVATGGGHFGLHHHPAGAQTAERDAREVLGLSADTGAFRLEDEDARTQIDGMAPLVVPVPFGNAQVGRVALAPSEASESDARSLLALIARELGGPLRIAALVEESQRLAAIDPLTGLMNRRAFLRAMTTETSRAKRYSVPLSMLLLDVDHFKSINDQRGHATGDQVLAALGAQLRLALRDTDLCARWGGEEFVVALTSTPEEGALDAAERLRRQIGEMSVVDTHGKSFKVTVSIGATAFQADDTVERLTDRADRAMYAAKVGGRDRVVVAPHEPAPPVSAASESLVA